MLAKPQIRPSTKPKLFRGIQWDSFNKNTATRNEARTTWITRLAAASGRSRTWIYSCVWARVRTQGPHPQFQSCVKIQSRSDVGLKLDWITICANCKYHRQTKSENVDVVFLYETIYLPLYGDYIIISEICIAHAMHEDTRDGNSRCCRSCVTITRAAVL